MKHTNDNTCTAYPVRFFYVFSVWHFIEETPGWLCCYSLRSSADWNVKEPKTRDFVTVLCSWGFYPSQESNSASSPVCCTTGNSLWGIEPQANQSDLNVVLFWTVSSEWWSLMNSPSSWPWERRWQLRLSVLPCHSARAPQGTAGSSCLNASWSFLFLCLSQTFQSPLKPLKVFEIELKGRLLFLSNVDSKTVDTYRN